MASKPNFSFEDSDTWQTVGLFEYLYTHIPAGYKAFFEKVDVADSLKSISAKLTERAKSSKIFPELPQVFRALHLCLKPRVIILGQDPYHNENSATGLCFSLPPGAKYINPSLRSIQKELISEGFKVNDTSGDLISWASQGVLLLNSSLSVEEGKPGTHTEIWAKFTEKFIKWLSENYNCVWLLWGADAQDYTNDIKNRDKQLILSSSHPSPLSCNRPCRGHPPFTGCGCFKKANEWLASNGESIIDWTIR